ncbi:unnamed protein product [Tetraodon nigroviridis]|uniref:(spotted green pufferfish) hypothetical protein n=1 Tax=Tetraodon nigroviridis TaxID=99883 RepID=Q4RTD5_TETNG|nr:unnamed protein product [Tetraodon nigroviridis]
MAGGGESKEAQPANHTSSGLKDDRRVSPLAETRESCRTDSLASKESYAKQTPFIKPAADAVHHPRNLEAKRLLLVRRDKLLCRANRTPENCRTV